MADKHQPKTAMEIQKKNVNELTVSVYVYNFYNLCINANLRQNANLRPAFNYYAAHSILFAPQSLFPTGRYVSSPNNHALF